MCEVVCLRGKTFLRVVSEYVCVCVMINPYFRNARE